VPTVRYNLSGSTITYVLPVRYAGMVKTRTVSKTTRRSMSGRRETYYESSENSYAITTKPLTEAQSEQLVAFLEAVEAGETFSFAPRDSDFSDAVLESSGYTEARQPELDKMFTYSLQINVLP
jgi:hypothetical protein